MTFLASVRHRAGRIDIRADRVIEKRHSAVVSLRGSVCAVFLFHLVYILFVGVGLSASFAAAGQPAVSVAISPGAREEVVFDWSKERCDEWDIPDAPLRVFRNQNEEVVAFSSNHANRPFIGGSLDKLARSCDSSYESRQSAEPADYSDMSWIAATWTNNGADVLALLHNEYHADRHPGSCRFATRMACWYNVVTAAVSSNGGRTFGAAVPPVVVAAPGFRQDVGQGRHRGFFNPSNIIEHDGLYYVLIATTGGEGQPPGTCLFRSVDIFDQTAWRAWDGRGFSARSADPYREAPTQANICQPLRNLPTYVGSVTRHQPSGQFIAILHLGGDAKSPAGRLVYSVSDDLVHWSAPAKVIEHPTMWSRNCQDQVRYAFAALVDPESPRRNFDSVGNTAYLYMTRFNIANCVMGPDRDLVRLKAVIASGEAR